MFWDFITRRTESLHGITWLMSDYGIPNGYRKMDYLPIRTYELHNKYGDRFFVRFNFRSCQGIENLSTFEANTIIPRDPNCYNTDFYDAIGEKKYPVWNLEINVMILSDVVHSDYDPFGITRMWKNGTNDIVPIGQLILNKNPDNFFKDAEQAAMNPANLVPDIAGPIFDSLFRFRRFSYRDAHIHRLGINHNRIHVNTPLYRKEYNRDGVPPVLENMNDDPMYYPNSFSGPVPYVDKALVKYSISVLQSLAVDLDVAASFYKKNLVTNDQKDRFVNNTVGVLLSVAPYMQRRVVRLYSPIDVDLGNRMTNRLMQAEQDSRLTIPNVLIPPEIKSCY